jgi:hypothetical protein
MGDSVELMVGRIEGQMEGIHREIKEIKGIIKCQSEDCHDCRSEIDEREEAIGKRIDVVSTQHVGETAVKNWMDNNLVRLGAIIGAVCGIAALAMGVRGLVWPG